jgi:hypothetical protein
MTRLEFAIFHHAIAQYWNEEVKDPVVPEKED